MARRARPYDDVSPHGLQPAIVSTRSMPVKPAVVEAALRWRTSDIPPTVERSGTLALSASRTV